MERGETPGPYPGSAAAPVGFFTLPWREAKGVPAVWVSNRQPLQGETVAVRPPPSERLVHFLSSPFTFPRAPFGAQGFRVPC